MGYRKPKPVIRKYAGSDAFMTQSARVIYSLLVTDMERFTAFDTTITSTRAGDFLTAIEQAETSGSDTTVKGILAQKTEAVNVLLQSARTQYTDMMYFVGKAFKDATTKKIFGFDDYYPSMNALKMSFLLATMETACEKYRDVLNDAGFSDTAINAVTVLKVQLEEALSDKDTFKYSRNTQTEERINILNNCYNFLALINKAAQQVFNGDPVKQAQYVYLPVKVRQLNRRVKKEIPAASE